MTQLLVQGSTILAVGPFTGMDDGSDSINAADAIFPKHVVEGWQIVECDVPEGFMPAGYTWDGAQAVAKPPVVALPTIADYTGAVQKHLDAAAQAKNYDDIVSACSYAGAPNPFQAEGQRFVAWRGEVWAKCYEIMAEVQSGSHSTPTIEGLIAELPGIAL